MNREDIMVYQLQEEGKYGVPETYTGGEIASNISENIKLPLGIFLDKMGQRSTGTLGLNK